MLPETSSIVSTSLSLAEGKRDWLYLLWDLKPGSLKFRHPALPSLPSFDPFLQTCQFKAGYLLTFFRPATDLLTNARAKN